jgi:hypothetical protein
MEEDLLKYITGTGTPTTETIQPQNVSQSIIDIDPDILYSKSLITNDKSYFIRYSGTRTASNSSIEVYNIKSLDNGEYLYKFTNISVSGNSLVLLDLKQDEDGRFYGIGYKYGADTEYYYLLLFNNFIQDGELKIRKAYSRTTMQVPNNAFNQIVKKKSSSDYYILSTINQIIHFKIDITSSNTTEIYNITQSGTITSGFVTQKLYIVNDLLILMQIIGSTTKKECKKLVIDTTQSVEQSYTNEVVYTLNDDAVYSMSGTIENYKFKLPLSVNNHTKLSFIEIDLNGNYQQYIYDDETFDSDLFLHSSVNFANNYIILNFVWNKIILFYFDGTNFIKFFEDDEESYTFDYSELANFKNYNIDCVMCISAYDGKMMYFKNIFSEGYSSTPYYNNNFMIPQYLNLYTNQNDNTSVVYSRDVSDRFAAGNQLTATFNIPNYMLNDETIKREIINTQTNLQIENDTTNYSKNRFENLYITYMYGITVNDNTNGNNLINQEGSNRIADSVWKRLDYQAVPLTKVRITYDDELSEIINLDTPTLDETTATYTFEVEGNIVKIEYLSNDENTVYATYRCNLTGHNTITQTIEVMEG